MTGPYEWFFVGARERPAVDSDEAKDVNMSARDGTDGCRSDHLLYFNGSGLVLEPCLPQSFRASCFERPDIDFMTCGQTRSYGARPIQASTAEA